MILNNIPTRSDVIKLIDQFDFNMLISYSRIITRRWKKLWYFSSRTNLLCILSLILVRQGQQFYSPVCYVKMEWFIFIFVNIKSWSFWSMMSIDILIIWRWKFYDWLMILLIWCEQKSCLLLLELRINVDKFLTLNKSITTKIFMHLLKFVKLLNRYSPDTNFIKFSVSNQIS